MPDLNVMLLEHAKSGLQAELDAAVTNGDTEGARKAADTAESEATASGREKRDELVAQAQRDIEAETRRSLESIRREVADLTVLATEKVTRKTLTEADQKRLVEEALGEVDFSALSGSEN